MDMWDVLETIMGLDAEDIAGMDRQDLEDLARFGYVAYMTVEDLSQEEDERIEDALIRIWDELTYKRG